MEDFPIATVPDDIDWSENYALAGYDPKTGVGVFLHIGRWRKDRSLWRELVSIVLPDGTVVASRAIGDARATPERPGGPHLAVDILENARRQTWSFLGGAVRVPVSKLDGALLSDGPRERVEFSLAFDSDLPTWQLGGGHGSGFAGRGHLEQIGRVTGTLTVGGATYEIDTYMNRDHSRGPRLMSSLARHIWFQGILSDGRFFMAYEAQESSLAQTTFSECAVIDGGELHHADIEVHFQLPYEDAMAQIQEPVSFTITYGDKSIVGQVIHYATTMHHQFSYPWDSYLGAVQIGTEPLRRMIEQAPLYKIEGGVTGYGHMERTVPGRLLNDYDLLG